MAIAKFQVHVCTQYGFPEHDPEITQTWAWECWENACKGKDYSPPLTDHLAKLVSVQMYHICDKLTIDVHAGSQITACTSTICGRICDKVLAKVTISYGFKPGSNPATIEHNKNLAAQLLADDAYVFEVSLKFYT